MRTSFVNVVVLAALVSAVVAQSPVDQVTNMTNTPLPASAVKTPVMKPLGKLTVEEQRDFLRLSLRRAEVMSGILELDSSYQQRRATMMDMMYVADKELAAKMRDLRAKHKQADSCSVNADGEWKCPESRETETKGKK